MKTRPEYEIGRFEFKYVLPLAMRDEVLRLVDGHVQPDPHARPLADGALGYQVHSLYFDTENLQDYFDRLDERRVRNRLRIRTYGRQGQGQPVFLENKRKSGRWVVKHRTLVGDADAWRWSTDERPWLALKVAATGRASFGAHSFNTLVNGARRVPVSVVHYDREVFVPQGYDAHHARLTLDRSIRAARASSASDFFQPGEVELVPPAWMVMELKFDRVAPRWMVELRRHLQVHAVPVSKYGLSVACTLRRNRGRELRLLTPWPLLGRTA